MATSALRAAYGKLPLAFEPNRGQTDGQVKFLTRGRGFTFYLTPAESVLALRGSVPGAESAAQEHNDSVTQSVLRIQLAGANRSAKIEPQRLLPGITNYFIGSDPSRWRTHIPNYARVLYRQVYPGIDAVYYGNEGRLETDFMVAPGKDPGVIRMKFSGAERTEVNSAGELVLTTATGDVKLAKPVLYQQVKGERREVAGAYRLLSANEAGFVVGRYDSTRALVIDPTLVYSTYLGGSGMSGDTGNAIAVDAAGEAFVTGSTNSTDFPTQSARQAALGGTGATNAFVTKLSASGSALVFSTYLGGSNFDSGEGIALDSTNEPYIAGFTRSTDFPKTNRTPLNGSQDGFVTKLSADGSTLLFSFYLGGEVDDKASGIAVDGSGNAYVTGDTTSTLFPVTAGVFQPSLAGSDNAFVSKFDTNGATVWSTYLGGNNQDRGKSVAFDASSNVYVTGVTQSTSFPLKNPFQSALGGLFARNVFVTELNPTGTALVYSTYLGGSASDDAGGIVVDSGANFIVAGDANSSDFPIVNSLQAKSQFGDDLFVAKFAPSGSSVLFSTLFGDQSGSTEARGVALDSSNNIYVTGQTNATLMPTLNPLQGTPSPSPFDFESVFVVEFKSDGSDYLFSTFLDGSSNVLAPAGSSFSDVGLGIAVDPSANIYITGTSMTSDFPTVTAFQVALKSAQGDAFVAKIAPATLAGPQIFPPVLLLSTVAVAQTSPISVVTIENGTNTLTISSISISGPNAADFFQTNSCGSTLVAHVVCTIAVTVTPSVAGPLTATLDIFDSDPTTPHTAIPLSASGTPPPAQGVLNVTPSSLTFGNQEVSVSSAPQTVTLSNPGNVPVTVSLTNSGTNPFDFSGAFGTPCFSGGSIAAGASCTVGVTFTPTATGNRTANLQFSGNFTGSPILVAVSGVGVPTIATLTPTILTFGNQVVNTTSAAQSFTLTNTSSTQTLSNIVVALSTFSGTTFAISNNTCTTTLAPNASCTISITFTPTTAGQGGAFVTVTDSDPALQRGFLQGTGLNPQATLSPLFTSQIMFGRQNVGTTSVPSSLGLLNIGNTALVFTTPITGANAADYAVTNTCGGSMAPGLSCLLQVTFTPLAIGPRLATLTINSSTAGVSGVPVVLSVSGTGVNPTTASLAPASLTFPSQAVGSTSAPMVVTFSNN
ncbi:MAG: choice-of-anchor D domain-containing protein, partial [Acidipila sp.]|nr:choice-of-anchor D domain-containing protein [Acidipila sp.]